MKNNRNDTGKFSEEIIKLIEMICHGHEKIFVTKLSPANRASSAHVNSPLEDISKKKEVPFISKFQSI